MKLPHMIEEHRLFAESFVTLGALEPELVVHVLVLVLQPVGAEHLSAESTRRTFPILCFCFYFITCLSNE